MEAEVWVAVVTVVGAGLAAFAGSAWQHRRRWDERRHEAFGSFDACASAFWYLFDDEGRIKDEAKVEQAVDDFRRAYSAAELICHRQQTSRSIDEVHDALFQLLRRPVEGRDFAPLDRRVHEALVAFSVAARSELGLPPLTFPTYSEYQREWGEA